LGRLTTTDYADPGTPDIFRAYDANSNLLWIQRREPVAANEEYFWYADPQFVNQIYTYDELNQLESETTFLDWQFFTQNHTYKTDGSLEKTDREYYNVFWPEVSNELPKYEHTITYGRDGLGRGISASVNGTNIASGGTFHPDGSVAGMSYGNGKALTRTLTPRQQTLRSLISGTGGTVLDLSYIYTPRGQVETAIDALDANHTRVFGYDGAGRLASASGPWEPGGTAGTASYTYDALGNLRTRTLGSRDFTYSYANNNRLTSHTDSAEGARSLGYDSRGNVTSLGGINFTYNAADKPSGMSGDENGAYRYDGHGRRVKSIVEAGGGNGANVAITRYNIYDASGALVWVTEGRPWSTVHVSQYVRMDEITVTVTVINRPSKSL